MPTLVTDTNQIVSDFPLAAVATKDSLDDAEWTFQPYVWCDKLTRAVNAYDEAELTRFIGDMIQPGGTVFDVYQPLDLVGKFVRVTIPQAGQVDDERMPLPDIVWVGYVVGTAKQRSAVKDAANPVDRKLTGRTQGLTAVGLEYFLDRVQIDASYVFKALPGSPGPEDLNYTRIQRVIPFNGGQGVALDADTRTRANRSAVTNTDSVYTFVPATEEGELWTLGNLIRYVLQYFQSTNKDNEPSPTTYILESVSILEGIAPSFNPERMTPFQVLNKLVCPQRGFVWWLDFNEGPAGHTATIRVETITGSDITLPALGTIPANRDQQTLDFDGQRDVEDVIVEKMGSRHYYQIITRGARMTTTLTIGHVDDASIHEAVSDWTVDIESLYQLAAAETTGYDDLGEDEQGKRNDAFRQSEAMSRPYSYFRISTEWDGKCGDGLDSERDWAFPELAADGTPTGSGLSFAVNGLRILNNTRLKRGWNYADATNIEDTTPEGTEADYMPMFATLKVSEAASGETARYQFVEKLGEHDFAAGELVSDTISVSYTLRAQQTAPGIILNAHGAQHACALNHWEGASVTGTEPQVDYETLRITCTLEADSYCEAKYPADDALPAGVPLQKLLLYVGDEYRLDYLAANTVVDLSNGEDVTTNGGVLRDDRKRLQDIARVAYEWYQLDRQPLTVKFQQIRNIWRLGMFITTIGSGTVEENVNTVVSMITYDCERGFTTIKTHDAALDIAKVA